MMTCFIHAYKCLPKSPPSSNPASLPLHGESSLQYYCSSNTKGLTVYPMTRGEESVTLNLHERITNMMPASEACRSRFCWVLLRCGRTPEEDTCLSRTAVTGGARQRHLLPVGRAQSFVCWDPQYPVAPVVRSG